LLGILNDENEDDLPGGTIPNVGTSTWLLKRLRQLRPETARFSVKFSSSDFLLNFFRNYRELTGKDVEKMAAMCGPSHGDGKALSIVVGQVIGAPMVSLL
jgi:hypothetical protein